MAGIGIGPRGRLVLSCFLKQPDVQFVAIADVQAANREIIRRTVNRHYGNEDCASYADMGEILAREDIERRTRIRQTNPISAACRANGLNNRERARVFEAFESLAPQVGMAEARHQACNLAASIASHRRTRLSRPTEPWEPTPPAAAA
jgi:hypothetical protein